MVDAVGEWYGEDCLAAGCHEGVRGSDGLEVVEDTSEVVLGETTWFSEARGTDATYYVADDEGNCLVVEFGARSGYYDEKGCYNP